MSQITCRMAAFYDNIIAMNKKTFNRPENTIQAEMLLSVIIPAHNAEKTLERAVESALNIIRAIEGNKTLWAGEMFPSGENTALPSAGEVLIIENGSGDGTELLSERLQEKHPDRVRALRSEKGVSNARNKGLDEAKGKWILFLDADDYYVEEAGPVVADDMFFKGTDLIVHSYEAGDSVIHLCRSSEERFSGDLSQICVRMIESPTHYTPVWSKLFRRSRIEYGHLRFDPSLRLSEDSLFVIRYLALCRRIRLSDRVFYHYSTDNGSVVRTPDGTKAEGYKKALLKVQSFLGTQPAEIRKAFPAFGMMQFNLLMVREVFAADSPYIFGQSGCGEQEGAEEARSCARSVSMKEKIRRMKQLSEEEPFAAAIREFDPGRHKGARYLPFLFMKKGAPAAAAAIYEVRALQNAYNERRQAKAAARVKKGE